MAISNIEKQYNKDLDTLRNKIGDYKEIFDKFKELTKNTIECNNNYLDLSKEKYNGYIFQGYGFCNASQNREFIDNKNNSINNQDQCKKICDSEENCSGFTMYKPGTHKKTIIPVDPDPPRILGAWYGNRDDQSDLFGDKNGFTNRLPEIWKLNTGKMTQLRQISNNNTKLTTYLKDWSIVDGGVVIKWIGDVDHILVNMALNKEVYYGFSNDGVTWVGDPIRMAIWSADTRTIGGTRNMAGPTNSVYQVALPKGAKYMLIGSGNGNNYVKTIELVPPKLPGKIEYDNRCYWFKDTPITEWNGSTVTKNNNLFGDDVMCFKKITSDMKMCPKEKPNCNGGICMSRDNTLQNLENEILILNNDIINSFVKLNNDYKRYKNSSEMINISKEIKLLNTMQELQVEKQLLKMDKEENTTNTFTSKDNILKSENKYYNYLLLLVILVIYSVYSLYRGENYDNIDYIILLLILLYVAYISYITIYK